MYPDDFLGIYEATADHLLADVPRAYRPRHRLGQPRPDLWREDVGKHYDENADGLADHDQSAATAGQEDHSDPWVFAGDDADAPGETS